MIKAIIFDCFGVLTTDGWLPFKKQYFGHDKQLLAKATELNSLANSRLISYGEFLSEIAKMAGVSTGGVKAIVENSVADQDLLDYIKTLKPQYKIGMLSNASANLLTQLFTKDQIALFDRVVLSYETGVRKPQEQAYRMTAEMLGAKASQCIFIDDQVKHIEGAQKVGMGTILYQNFEQMKEELEALITSVSDN